MYDSIWHLRLFPIGGSCKHAKKSSAALIKNYKTSLYQHLAVYVNWFLLLRGSNLRDYSSRKRCSCGGGGCINARQLRIALLLLTLLCSRRRRLCYGHRRGLRLRRGFVDGRVGVEVALLALDRDRVQRQAVAKVVAMMHG